MRRFAILPLLCYTLMIVYACYGAVVVGHWPYYAHPDPKELPLRTLLHVVAIVMLVGALSVLLLPVGYVIWRLVIRLRCRAPSKHRASVWIYTSGALVWIIDLAGVFGWSPWPSLVSWVID